MHLDLVNFKLLKFEFEFVTFGLKLLFLLVPHGIEVALQQTVFRLLFAVLLENHALTRSRAHFLLYKSVEGFRWNVFVLSHLVNYVLLMGSSASLYGVGLLLIGFAELGVDFELAASLLAISVRAPPVVPSRPSSGQSAFNGRQLIGLHGSWADSVGRND